MSYNYEVSVTNSDLALFGGIFLAFFITLLVIGIVGYIVQGIALTNVAKDNGEPVWMAWVPIANIVLIIKTVEGKLWTLWAFAVYFVGIVLGTVFESPIITLIGAIALIAFFIYQCIVLHRLGGIYGVSRVLFWVGLIIFPCYLVYFYMIGKAAKENYLNGEEVYYEENEEGYIEE